MRPCLNTPSLPPRKSYVQFKFAILYLLSCFCCYLHCEAAKTTCPFTAGDVSLRAFQTPTALCCAGLSSLKLIQRSFVISKFKLSELSSLRLGQDRHVFKARECGRKLFVCPPPPPHFFFFFLWLRQSLTGFLAAVLVLGFKCCVTMPTHIYLSIVVITAFSSFF